MIVVTGAAGFIASALIARLNELGFKAIVAVDDFKNVNSAKERNLEDKAIRERVDLEDFHAWLDANQAEVEFIFHNGACSATTVFDKSVFDKLNYNYTKKLWEQCVDYQLPLVYASSAATYGDGALGYDDDHSFPPKLKPLNLYGESKNNFDIWALEQEKAPFFWAGLKYFNVYGPNEYHKERMASVVHHAYNQIKEKGAMKLFQSHHPDFEDGGQMRDFVYVKDVVEVQIFLMNSRKHSGIYNVGTGKARTFKDLVLATFAAMDKPVDISYIPTPEDIRDKYQYFTEAKMEKLKAAGYKKAFHTLEEGVTDYVKNYLLKEKAIY
ncbi:ADP-glyceromanno-heptose 6-epimerase [Persicobacter diffluens]|uniref:ADP-L-glycero-D-manno-heptose-6-epimerase n=1 Tax=Persicobacter diffluens TaxID=981 RepID=A0AAN4VVE9_9BACT|nr:ADP-L-glycero-D-manno-heptose-6-epimerase [Persicobacter diffluens]